MAIRLKVQDTTGVTLKVGGSDTARLSAETGIPIYPYEYTGEYEVTPRLYEQTLATENKTMLNDVTVYEIPISRTTNPTGGLTVLIG